MDTIISFCQITVMSVSGGSRFIVLGDGQFGLNFFLDLKVRNEFIASKFPIFIATFLSNFETQLCRCSRLANYAREMGFRMSFYLNLVPLVCGGA